MVLDFTSHLVRKQLLIAARTEESALQIASGCFVCQFSCDLQMAVSKRSLSLGKEHAGQGAHSGVVRNRGSPISQWRVEHGFPVSPDPTHLCTGRCAYVNIVDNAYLCENCGREHVCDEHCKERVLDTASGMPVCPISGVCFDQLDAAWEVCLQITC